MGVPMFGQEHVDRYRETDGEEGHDWQGTTVLLLTTTGRRMSGSSWNFGGDPWVDGQTVAGSATSGRSWVVRAAGLA
jgi:hypothetical protein